MGMDASPGTPSATPSAPPSRRPRRIRALVATGLLAAAGALALGATNACVDNRCIGTAADYGPGVANAGAEDRSRLVDDDTWETSGQADTWLSYSHERTWFFHLPEAIGAGRSIVSVEVYISADSNPVTADATPDAPLTLGFTAASGNLSVIGIQDDHRFWVRNDTCAEYFVRVVAHLSPRVATDDGGADAADGGDAGEPDDAAAIDASRPDADVTPT